MSPRSVRLCGRVEAFMNRHVVPNEPEFERQCAEQALTTGMPPLLEELKALARNEGLWNLFLPDATHGAGLTNLEYAPIAEAMGRVYWAPEVFNCSAPDTGNMELLHVYGSEAQKKRWLEPLLAGDIRSAYCMTEPDVASSDATNIRTEIRRDGDYYVISGKKWWITNGLHPQLRILIVMGRSDLGAPKHQQQSQILVPVDTPGVSICRPLPIFGFSDLPGGHAEVQFDGVRVPTENLILGEGRGFEIAQGRLGPGRIHHCMRCVGVAERALELTCDRLVSRVAFGRPLAEQSVWQQRIAEARIDIDQARLLVYQAAALMDTVGNRAARKEIAAIKVAVPRMAQRVVDMAVQAFGGAGVTGDFGLSGMYARTRTMRIVDGPDEVHNLTIAKLEFKRRAERAARFGPTTSS